MEQIKTPASIKVSADNIAAIENILKCGFVAEVKRERDNVTVIEIRRQLKQKTNLG